MRCVKLVAGATNECYDNRFILDTINIPRNSTVNQFFSIAFILFTSLAVDAAGREVLTLDINKGVALALDNNERLIQANIDVVYSREGRRLA